MCIIVASLMWIIPFPSPVHQYSTMLVSRYVACICGNSKDHQQLYCTSEVLINTKGGGGGGGGRMEIERIWEVLPC